MFKERCWDRCLKLVKQKLCVTETIQNATKEFGNNLFHLLYTLFSYYCDRFSTDVYIECLLSTLAKMLVIRK